jgi:hypothetical protein
MQIIATVIILLAVVTALAQVTDRIRVPYSCRTRTWIPFVKGLVWYQKK